MRIFGRVTVRLIVKIIPKHKRLIVAIVATITLATLGILFLIYHFPSSPKGTKFSNLIDSFDSPSPSPFPFQEITIPALRARNYKSALNERAPIYQDPNHIAYLTSYDSDGHRVNGLLVIPTGQQPPGGWPAIVFIHGYIPPSTYQTQSQYSEYVNYLARAGFVVFKIDLRGHGQSEGTPSGAYYSDAYIADTLNARAALQKAEEIDPDKIGLWGHSMAGNVVMRSLAARPKIPAVVIWAGAVYSYEDWQKYGLNDNSYRPPDTSSERMRTRQRIHDLYGKPDQDNEFWQLVAPTNFLNDIKGSIQLHHAIDDQVVNIGYSRDLNAQLAQTSIVHELHEYQGGGHNISDSFFTQAMENTIRFFIKEFK